MTDEAALLAAIADRPGDPLPRLVYADWLDDRGDPRAELVRIEEQMRTLPAHADRYWALKPRRNDLRAGCPVDWLAALGYGTVYRPVLGPWPGADVRGRFRLLRELVERWYGEPLPDVGGRAEEVAAVETRLRRPGRLPPAVREWVAFVADIAAQPPADHLVRDALTHDDLRRLTDPNAESLFQVDGGIDWRPRGVGTLRSASSARADPPVVAFDQPHESATDFALGFFLGHLGGGQGGFSARVVTDADWWEEVSDYFPTRTWVGGVTYLEAEDVLARHFQEMGGGDELLCVRVRRSGAVAGFPEFLRRLARTPYGVSGVFMPPSRPPG